jgi:beta-N-acetylhexosaminidase
MGAIANNFDNTYAVIEVFKAGIDIALVPIDLKSPQDKLKLETLFEGLENAVKTGDLNQENIDNSVRKILALKKKMKILDPANYAQSPAQKIAQAQKFYNDPKIFIAQREMAQKAVTLIKNNGKILPIKTDLPPKILILSPNAKANDALKLAVNQLVGEGVINKKTFFDILDYSLLQNLKPLNWQALFKDYDYIIAVSDISNFSNVKNLWQVKTIRNIIEAANSNNKKLVLISAGLTYDTAYYTKAPAILACFGMQPSMPNIQASMDIIFGLQKPMGKLPIDIPQADPNTLLFKNKILYKIKHGLSF